MKRPIAPMSAFELLIEGNERFVSGQGSLERRLTLEGLKRVAGIPQTPIAIVLTCADSRIPVETVFDRGPGEIFTLRVAGNILTPYQLASIEFAVSKFKTTLCVIMGHSDCGAIRAAIEAESKPEPVLSPHIQALVERIRPSVRRTRSQHPEVDPADPSFSHHVCWENIRNSVSLLTSKSEILAKSAAEGTLLTAGAYCELSTGRVHFDWEQLRSQGHAIESLTAFREAK